MVTHQVSPLQYHEAQHYSLFDEDQPLPFGTFLQQLAADSDFQANFIRLLSNVPYQAYHWETPPVTKSSLDQPFEFVVTNSPGIDLPPDYGPFQSHFHQAPTGTTVTDFPNLGGDAQLIVPLPDPEQPKANYSHIGVFTENAPLQQQHDLWQMVGRITSEQLSDRPIWLNTAGGGVAWLHVRLDARPKYYLHRPYRQMGT